MRAAVYHAPGHVEIADVAEPEPGPGQVKIRVGYNGICGSDLHEYYGAPMMIPCEVPHPRTGVQAPVVIGHECGGEVVAVGEGVDDLAIGSLVAVEPINRCGVCVDCLAGDYNLCSDMAFHGFSTGGGGLAQYTVVDRVMAHELPSGFDSRQAALIEPLAVSYHAVRRSRAEAGQTVAVHGAGPIGLGAALALRHLGIDVILTDPSAERRSIAASVGLPTVLDPAADDVVAAILDVTQGRGAAATIDAAGVPSVLDTALFTTAKHGTIVFVAIPQVPIALTVPFLFMTEVDLRASTAYRGEFPLVIDAMAAGAYPLDGWVSTIPLAQLVSQGYEELHAGRGMKILVDPHS